MSDLAKSTTSSLRALLAGFTQDTRLLRLTTPLGQDTLLAECVRGHEAIDEGFSFDIDALSPDAGIALKRLVGQPALLQLLTASPGQPLRPFHGYVTAARMSGANGGLARYRLRLEPWTAFLSVGRDSRVFHHMSVPDIVESVFSAWRRAGRIRPAWRIDLLDRSVYSQRSLTTQYEESDLAFVLRLLNEEGLFCRFEHTGAPHEAPFGSHVLVIADHNRTFKPNPQPLIRFTQPGTVMQTDSLDGWQVRWSGQAGAVEINSWDYRARIARPVSAAAGDSADLTVHDTMGQYAWSSREHGERLARNELQALTGRRERHSGAGTVRTLAPGTTFTVSEHAQLESTGDEEACTFVALRVAHLMHNNFTDEIREAVQTRLQPGLLEELIGEELGASMHAASQQAGERPLYRMRVDAMRRAVPYRSGRRDEQGQLRHPKPAVGGQQTAIVVGPAGSVIHTDRDHRIKVQFHWQRGVQSHSRLHHPDPEGHTGAPADDSAGTWVRVATPLGAIAGANWGSNTLPRVGQEVLVDFMHDDIDRPVVIATLYNGRGETDAQHNRAKYGAGVATGNAPAWFPGESGAHAHPAVLSGLKSQAMAASSEGNGAYSQLVFDATAGQPRVALQRHAAGHQGTDELNLGHLRHQVDNQRLQAAGFGAELKTAHSMAVRAAQGLLVSSQGARSNANLMDAREAHAQIVQTGKLLDGLAGTAKQHNAALASDTQAGSSSANKLPAIEQLTHSAAAIEKAASEPAGRFSEARLQLASSAGIFAGTPSGAVLYAGNTSSIGAGQDLNFTAQGSLGQAISAGVSLFTYGKASSPQKPNQETGIRLHAASGTLSVQSQTDSIGLTADKAITVASVTKVVTIAAKQHVMLTALGACIKLEDGNITLQCPGTIEFKAGMKELAGPKDASEVQLALPEPSALTDCTSRVESAVTGGANTL